MSLLNNDERYARLIINLEFHAGFSDRTQFVRQDRNKLSFADAVAIKYDPRRFESRGSIELDQKFFDHDGKFVNDFLSMLLYANSGGITRRMGIHASDNLHQIKEYHINKYQINDHF